MRAGFPWILPEEKRMFLGKEEVGGAFCLPSWPVPLMDKCTELLMVTFPFWVGITRLKAG